MELLRFDEQELAQELRQFPASFRTAFAAASAERLLPAYVRFSHLTGRGDPAKLTNVLERLWQNLEGGWTSREQEQEDIDLCTSLLPQEDSDCWVPEQAYAEDGVAALIYALRSRKSGQAQEAAWAARRIYEALDRFVVTQEGIDTNEIGAEKRVLSHPLIQAELSRQQRDIRELAGSGQNLAQVSGRIRERARADSETVFESKPH